MTHMNKNEPKTPLLPIPDCDEPYTCPTCPYRHECRQWKPKAKSTWNRICLRLGIPLEERGEF